ncbi:MAG: DUF4215 domain-containing protein [Myxococcaceae bacterium]|nr:DUF4215 domain-containing protein [Myxococcaceae bacterium]
MRQDSPAALHRSITAFALALLGPALSSCLELGSTTCASGLVCPAGMRCAANQDVCIAASPSCGDGIVQASVNEACDDGNILSGDGCNADCRSNEQCGNNIVDIGEVCDDGNSVSGDRTCSADCLSDERCGNNIKDIGEMCDDGNNVSGDRTCSADCRSDERCGNNIVDVGEDCDDGNTVGGDTCGADCRSGGGCGDGELEPGEQCDDGNTNNDDNCVNLGGRCVVARCGDGFVAMEAPNIEECDDGNTSDEDSCLNTCKKNRCGDNRLDPEHEACDDGNITTEETCPYGTRDCTVCTSDCSEERTLSGPYCGDGVPSDGEACDDGSRNGAQRCQYGEESCWICNADCTDWMGASGDFCGDEIVNTPQEQCDFGEACGTCSAGCRIVDAVPAEGSLKIVERWNISPGDSFVISDGMNPPVTFKFASTCTNPLCANTDGFPRCCISLGNNPTEHDLTQEIHDTINIIRNRDELEVSAGIDSGRVTIRHHRTGTLGNQRIISSDPDALRSEGMSGGVGADCPANSWCRGDDDCAEGLQCQDDHRCAPW